MSQADPAEAPGPPLHPFLALLAKRLAAGSKPGARHDGAKLALAIEGGGMRGVVSAGMDAALEDLGMLDAFDEIYGSSAGSFNGAYLLSHRARVGATIYYEDVNNRRFIDIRRAVRAPVLDLDFMLDDVAERVKPIDWEGVLDSTIPLYVVAFSLERRRTVLVEYRSHAELKSALKASSSIPWVAGNPVELADGLYWDASFHDGSIPVRIAQACGATHVLAFLTRPSGILRGKPNLMERRLIAPHVRKFGRDLAEIYLSRAESYAESIAEIRNATE